MAEWLSQTNQKLYQARLLLDALDVSESSANTADVFNNSNISADFVLALQESVLFQLVLAYQSYLHEIAEIAQWRESFLSLAQLIESAPTITGEMKELKKIEDDDFSWLSQLLAAFQQCGDKNPVAVKAATSPSMIQIQDTTSASLPLRDWYDHLIDLIDLQRNNRQES